MDEGLQVLTTVRDVAREPIVTQTSCQFVPQQVPQLICKYWL